MNRIIIVQNRGDVKMGRGRGVAETATFKLSVENRKRLVTAVRLAKNFYNVGGMDTPEYLYSTYLSPYSPILIPTSSAASLASALSVEAFPSLSVASLQAVRTGSTNAEAKKRHCTKYPSGSGMSA